MFSVQVTPPPLQACLGTQNLRKCGVLGFKGLLWELVNLSELASALLAAAAQLSSLGPPCFTAV